MRRAESERFSWLENTFLLDFVLLSSKHVYASVYNSTLINPRNNESDSPKHLNLIWKIVYQNTSLVFS